MFQTKGSGSAWAIGATIAAAVVFLAQSATAQTIRMWTFLDPNAKTGREVVLNFCGAGEYVGEMSLDGAPRSASVITIEPTSCAIVNRSQFRDFLAANPDFAQHIIKTLIHRARNATENVKSLALQDVYGRLVRLLNALALEQDGKHVVQERLTQQDIADRVGASRDMIGKLMKDLVGGGYLVVEDRQITIVKRLPPGW